MSWRWGKLSKLAFLALSVLMVSCLERGLENKKEIDPPVTGGSGSDTGIPDDFDYETTDTHKLTVKVKDEYEGKYYYTVDIYDTNPVFNTSASLLVRAKTNSKVPFEFDIVVPKGQKSVFVRVKDPQGYRFVTELKIGPGNLLLDFNAPASETKALSSLRSSRISEGEVDYQSFFNAKMQNANATEITNDVTLENGGKYKITNKSFAGEVSLPKGAFTLYVGEGCKLILGNKGVQLDGAEIYVLKDASIETKVDVVMKRNACIYNAGRVDMKSISLEGSELYNHSGSSIKLINLSLNGGNIYNHCLIKANEVLFDGAGSNIYLRQASSLDANNVKFEKGNAGSAIYMETKSFLHTNNFHKNSDVGLDIYGDPWYHILPMKEQPVVQVNGNIKGSNIRMLRGVLLSAKGWSDKIDFVELAGVVDGDLPCDFQGSCYATEVIPDKDRPIEGDASDPEATFDPETEATPTCIYMFEDNWPNIGDYDMNDVVINVGVACDTKGGNATTVHITGEVIAVGANKDLYVFARIMGTDKIVNLLGGVEIHGFMGKHVGEKINTSKKDCDAKDIGRILVDVEGMKGIVNSNNLDVFIVWGDPAGSNRNEVHIPRFTGTSQAAKSENSTVNYKYKSNDENNNLMWSLMVPKGDFSYPKEGNSIMEAYPMFMDWVKSGGGNDVSQWYNAPVEEKVMH